MSRTNKTRHIQWHKTSKCKCRLDTCACNNKQHWNKDKSRCKCEQLIETARCHTGFIWNPSNCECECDIRQYLHYKHCKCRKKISLKN